MAIFDIDGITVQAAPLPNLNSVNIKSTQFEAKMSNINDITFPGYIWYSSYIYLHLSPTSIGLANNSVELIAIVNTTISDSKYDMHSEGNAFFVMVSAFLSTQSSHY